MSAANCCRHLTHLIGHDHEMAISETVRSGVVLAVLQAQNLLDMLDLDVLNDLVVSGFPYVEQLASEREDAVVIPTDNSQARHSKGFGGVSFCEDQGAAFSVAAASIVGVLELHNTGDTAKCSDPGLIRITTITYRLRFAPSDFLRIWSCLNFAQFKTLSMMPDFETGKGDQGSVKYDKKIRVTFLHELLRQVAFAAKCRAFQRQAFFCLRVEGRILDEGVDEDPHVALDLKWLDRRGLVFLFDLIKPT